MRSLTCMYTLALAHRSPVRVRYARSRARARARRALARPCVWVHRTCGVSIPCVTYGSISSLLLGLVNSKSVLKIKDFSLKISKDLIQNRRTHSVSFGFIWFLRIATSTSCSRCQLFAGGTCSWRGRGFSFLLSR